MTCSIGFGFGFVNANAIQWRKQRKRKQLCEIDSVVSGVPFPAAFSGVVH